MRSLLKFIVVAIIAVVAVSCEMRVGELITPPNTDENLKPAKPTSPIKRRPIVPTTHLPRPRVMEEYNSLSCDVSSENEESVVLSINE